MTQCRRDVQWQSSIIGVTKVNFGATLDGNNHKMEKLIKVKSYFLCATKQFVGKSTLAVGYALWRAIELCNELQVKDVLFEGDAKIVTDAVGKKEHRWTSLGILLEDLQQLFFQRPD